MTASRACNYLQNAAATTYKKFLQFYAKRSCKKHAGRSEEEDGPSEKPQEIGCYVQKCAVICAITEDVNLSWERW